MIIKGDLECMECQEVRIFQYALLAKELGAMPKYQKYDGWECEEIMTFEIVGNDVIQEHGWQIIGTNRIVERQWTIPIKEGEMEK